VRRALTSSLAEWLFRSEAHSTASSRRTGSVKGSAPGRIASAGGAGYPAEVSPVAPGPAQKTGGQYGSGTGLVLEPCVNAPSTGA
jgi:hypothetical protein